MASLFTLVTLLGTSLAAPTSGQSASLPHVSSGQTTSGVENLVRTLNVLGKPVPDNLAQIAKQNRHLRTSVPATSNTAGGTVDYDFLTPVTIGGKKFNVVIDTGYTDVIVYSTLQPKDTDNGHPLYNPNHGKRFKNDYLNQTFGPDNWDYGPVYTDSVTFGGITVPNQAIGAVSQISPEFAGLTDPNTDGAVGFAFKPNSNIQKGKGYYGQPGFTYDPQSSWLENIQSSLAQPLVAAYFKASPAEPQGSWDIGYIDTSHYQGTIVYTPVNSSTGLWATDINYEAHSGSLMSSGSTLSSYADDTVIAYYADTPAYVNETLGIWVVDCSYKFKKDFPMSFGKINSALEAQYMNAGIADSSNPNVCQTAVQQASLFGNSSIFGSTFHKGKYVVYTFGKDGGKNPQVGVAWQRGHGPKKCRK